MANEYYDHTTYPSTGASGSSSAMRAELNTIEAGFDKLPTLAGNGGKIPRINAGGTAMESSKVTLTDPATTATLTLADNSSLVTVGAYSVTWTATGTTTLTLPTTGTLATVNGALGAATATSINKVALTAPATGATLTIADGKTLTASNTLTLAGTDGTTMTFPATSASIARTDAAQAFTGTQSISGGQLLLNHTATITEPTNIGSQLQINGISGTDDGGISMFNWRNNAAITQSLNFYKSKSSATGTLAAVTTGDDLGQSYFYGAGDASTWLPAAYVLAEVDDGAVSATSMPGKLSFATTANGAAAPTIRNVIYNNGAIHFGGNSTTETSRVVIGNTGVPKDTAFGGPIVTLSGVTAAGSGYVDGTYTDVALSYSTGAMGSAGTLALATITVAGGVVTNVALTWGGINYYVGDVLTASNSLLGGTGSGFTTTVATVRKATLTLISFDSSGADVPKLRMTLRDATLGANQEIGSVLFGGVDTAPAKSSGDYASISAYAVSTGGGGYVVISASAAGVAESEVLRVSSTGITVTGVTTSTAYTVATLPAGSQGMRAFVSDANATTFASVVAGGGSNGVPVYHNGTNWRIG